MNKKEKILELKNEVSQLRNFIKIICIFLSIDYEELRNHGRFFTQNTIDNIPATKKDFNNFYSEMKEIKELILKDIRDTENIVPTLVTKERFDKNIDKLNSLIELLGYEYKQEPAKEGWFKIINKNNIYSKKISVK